jgi:hypothetical protein
MATRKANDPELDNVTSAGVPWSQVPEFVRADVEWMDGRHGSAKDILPAVSEVPVPDVLFSLPRLHEQRPRGSKAMIDAHGARSRLAACRPALGCSVPSPGRSGRSGLTEKLVGFHRTSCCHNAFRFVPVTTFSKEPHCVQLAFGVATLTLAQEAGSRRHACRVPSPAVKVGMLG